MTTQLDQLAPNFRKSSDKWFEAATLKKHYEAIGQCYSNGSYGLVEHIMSFIECVCITVLNEHGEQLPPGKATTTDLLIAALKPLGLQNTRNSSKMSKILSSFNKLADALYEMRNENGSVAHGKDGFLDLISIDHTRAFLFTGDAILGVIHAASEGVAVNLMYTREPYGAVEHLCRKIDENVGMEALVDDEGDTPVLVVKVKPPLKNEPIDLRISVSKLLYGVDRSVFIEVLNEAMIVAKPTSVSLSEEYIPSAIYTTEQDRNIAEVSLPTMLSGPYKGKFRTLDGKMSHFLKSESLNPQMKVGSSTLLDLILYSLDENIGLDWQERDIVRARIKVAAKRSLVSAGLPTQRAEEVSEKILTWLPSVSAEINAMEGFS